MTSDARTWIAALPGDSFFASADVPGPASAVQPLLSRLAADRDGDVRRVKNGLYWKKPAAGALGIRPQRPSPRAAGLAAGGQGSGLASFSALNALGLSTQVPKQPTIAVVRRPPSGVDGVRFVSRSNLARLALTNFEVTVLEALRMDDVWFDASSVDLTDKIRGFVADGRVRLDGLRDAAAKDHDANVHARMAALTG